MFYNIGPRDRKWRDEKPEIVLPEVGLADDSRPFPMAELCLENGLCPPMAEKKF